MEVNMPTIFSQDAPKNSKQMISMYKHGVAQLRQMGTSNAGPAITAYIKDYVQPMYEKYGTVYCVLCVIIDEMIGDVDDVREIISNAVDLPFSVVFIGLGGASFGNMDKLDESTLMMNSLNVSAMTNKSSNKKSKKPKRPMTQFIKPSSFYENEEKLSIHALNTIKEQFLTYYRLKEIETYSHIPNSLGNFVFDSCYFFSFFNFLINLCFT